MKYEALQFLRSMLGEQSQVFVLAGNSPWLRKQIRIKLKEKYGDPIELDGEDEEELSSLGDIVCQSPLGSTAYTYVRADNVTKNWLNKKLELIDMPSAKSFVLIEMDLDTPWKQTELERWKVHAKIHLIMASHPNDETTKLIIRELIKAAALTVDGEKLAKVLFENYKNDFDAIENNIEKTKLSGNFGKKTLDEADPGMKDSWSCIDAWIEGRTERAIYHLKRTQNSEISPVAVHQQFCKQFRRYLLITSESSDYFTRLLMKRSEHRSQGWLYNSYKQLITLQPMLSSYYDRVIQCICSDNFG